MHKKKIGVIVGSLRRNSYSKAIAQAFSKLMPEDFSMEVVDIGDLPIFNQDYDDDDNTPQSYTAFREKIGGMDGFLFVTPEYNRSYPAVIKNALDVASRPYGENKWNSKPAAIISVSPGRLGAFGANHHLRQVMAFLNIYVMQQPEAYIGNVGEVVDENGNIKDDKTIGYLKSIAKAFADWLNRF